MTSEERQERDKAIARAYRAGVFQRDLAEQYGLCLSRICRIIKEQGARLSPEEIRKRATTNLPDRSPGRPRLYDSTPEARTTYEALRKKYHPNRVREIMRARFPSINHPK